jgi:type IV secretory pathway VirB10-like protein
MSSKAKTIAFSVAALLAVAGGVYAFMPSDQGNAASAGPVTSLAQTAAEPGATPVQTVPDEKLSEKAKTPTEAPVTLQPPVAPADPLSQPVAAAPKKLTRQQLTPPAPTEEEKLQKAAEQESNF